MTQPDEHDWRIPSWWPQRRPLRPSDAYGGLVLAVLALGYAAYGCIAGGIFLPTRSQGFGQWVTGPEAVAAILGLAFLGFSFLGFALMVHDPVDGRRRYARFRNICAGLGVLLLLFGPMTCALLFR